MASPILSQPPVLAPIAPAATSSKTPGRRVVNGGHPPARTQADVAEPTPGDQATSAFRIAPQPTRVDTRYHGPLSFGVSATGGDFHDVCGAIVNQLRQWSEAGLIGPAALTDAGHALLDAAQDRETAA
ncbi:MAG: hypothetical protein DYG90_00465 [Chloroflexi bacterium CFX6]|nr:hypothetical protein [Chloroflexi bacterium CFX6]